MIFDHKAVSARKMIANRLNAAKSTGPRTLRGKEFSRRNALKHGFRSERIIDIDHDHHRLLAVLKSAGVTHENAQNLTALTSKFTHLVRLQCDALWARGCTTNLWNLLRYEQSLGRQLRHATHACLPCITPWDEIQSFSNSQEETNMHTTWDLFTDGVLWKAALEGFEPSPELETKITNYIARLQDAADRSDPAQLLTCDKRAANFIRQLMVIAAESGHRRLQAQSAKRAMPAGTPISAEELAAATLPHAEISRTLLKYQIVLDRQDHFDALLLERQQHRAQEQERLAAKKPTQAAADAAQKTEAKAS